MKLNFLSEKLQELNKGGTFLHVSKELLLWCLQVKNKNRSQDLWLQKAKISCSISEAQSPAQTFDKWLQT